MSSPTPPPKLSNSDSDPDVIGFADQPYYEPPFQTTTGSRSAEPKWPLPETPVVQTNGETETQTRTREQNIVPLQTNTRTTQTTRESQTVQENAKPNVRLHGWRLALDGSVATLALTIPYIGSMIISFCAATKVPVHDFPPPVMLACVLSCIELSTFFIFYVISAILGPFKTPSPVVATADRAETNPTAPQHKPLSHVVFNTWLGFMMLSPVISGIYIWVAGDHVNCKDGDSSAECKIGNGYIQGIGAYRTVAIYIVYGFSISCWNVLSTKLAWSQVRANAARGQTV